MNIRFSPKTKKYDRFQIACFDITPQTAEFVSPSGKMCVSEFFLYQPAEFIYDRHGYEKTVKTGEPYYAARFTPEEVGTYKFEIKKDGETVFCGEFECLPSDNNGFVEVSKKDCRYFAYSDGKTYCPVGINMCYPTEYAASSGSEFGTTGGKDFIGLNQYRVWLDDLAKAGGNFARIWLGKEYFSPDCADDCRDLKYEQFTKLDKLVEMARERGIKLKLTFEHFRKVLTPEKEGATGIAAIFDKTFCMGGEYCPDFETWLTDEKWQAPWRNKIDEFLKRYGGDTTIFAFELWNEMNCVEAPTETMLAWTDKMCSYIRGKVPNMAVNSVGSYDNAQWASFYKMFESDKLSFSQIHRYLDQGAQLEECYTDIPLMAKAGFDRMWKKKNPVLLAETGAVNDVHVGPFRYYDSDYDGIIFADVTYPAFFCESAGCGQIWHWDARYVSGKNLYKMYKPFADMVRDEQLDDEDFKFVNLSNKMAYILLLVGKTKIFGLVRNTDHNWENVLRDLKKVSPRLPLAIDSTDFYIDDFVLQTYPIWEDDTTEIIIKNRRIEINNLKYGMMFKLKKD